MTDAKVKNYGVIVAPFVTEKAATLAGDSTRVVLKVTVGATKVEIKEAVEKIFGVKVKSVNTVNYMGKPKRTRGMMGKRADYKKAYVTLRDGEKISMIEGV